MAEVKPGAKFRDVGDIISQHAQQQGCVSAQRLYLSQSLHVQVLWLRCLMLQGCNGFVNSTTCCQSCRALWTVSADILLHSHLPVVLL